MITSEIYSRVFLISGETDQGTAFTVEHNKTQYLVSAYHIFENDNLVSGQEIVITIFHEEEWKKFKVKAHLHDNENIDIVVFEFDGLLSHTHQIEIGSGGMMVCQDVFFLGFPYGMFAKVKPEMNRNFPFPFAKKSTCSAFKFKSYEGDIIYLDGHTNPGFSGGPIIFEHNESKKMKIAGVMSGYVVHEGKIEIEEVDEDGNVEDEELTYDENSGIITVHAAKHIIEIIDKIGRESV